MKAFIKHLLIHLRMDVRERNVLLTYYLVPLVFYFVMGAVFSSINPASKQSLCASMSIFALTMGAVLGILVLFIITSLALGLLIGVFAKNGAMSVMLSQAVFLPSLMLGGLMFPASMLPDALRIAGRIFPATFAMQSFLAVGFSQSPEIALPVALTAMAAISLICSVVVALRFRMIARS